MQEGERLLLPNLNQRVSAFLGSLKESLRKLSLPLQKTFLSGIVLSLKHFLDKTFFKCSERLYKLYSWLFMFVPAVGFFCVTFIMI